MKIGILGAGTWGIALAKMLAVNEHEVVVWSALKNEIEELSENRVHPNLPGVELPDEIKFTSDAAEACQNKDIILFAVPSVFVRSTSDTVRPFISDGQIIVDVAKGIEPGTLMTMTEVIYDELNKDGKHSSVKLVALSGPTHAEEVALDMPSSIVSACTDEETAKYVQDVFMNTCMRIYTNTDVKGVELCGALKNIVALAAGISAGLGYGDNTRAALITRGMAEITRLGAAMGCRQETFSGLAGIGDMIVTATSEHSRNNRCGKMIGRGMEPKEAIARIGMVVEGVNAIPAAIELADKYGTDMPIVRGVNAIINFGYSPAEQVYALMTRKKKSENGGIYETSGSTDKSAALSSEPKRVIAYGTFDCIDYREIERLKRIKDTSDVLIVALRTESSVSNAKQNYNERKTVLEALKAVDLVLPTDNSIRLAEFVRKYRAQTVSVEEPDVSVLEVLAKENVGIAYNLKII